MAEQTTVDFSEKRDTEIQELFDALPYLVNNKHYYSRVAEKNEVYEIESYPTYSKKRVLANINETPRVNIAIGVLKTPVAVWRDFREHVDNRKGTTLEYFFGLIKKGNEHRFVLLIIQRNILIEIHTSKREEELLDRISGLQIFKRF